MILLSLHAASFSRFMPSIPRRLGFSGLRCGQGAYAQSSLSPETAQ